MSSSENSMLLEIMRLDKPWLWIFTATLLLVLLYAFRFILKGKKKDRQREEQRKSEEKALRQESEHNKQTIAEHSFVRSAAKEHEDKELLASVYAKEPMTPEPKPEQKEPKNEPEKKASFISKAKELEAISEVLEPTEEKTEAIAFSSSVGEKDAKEPQIEEAIRSKVLTKNTIGAALKGTRSGFMAKLSSIFSRGRTLSDEDFEEMEAILFTSDIGARTAQKLLDAMRKRVAQEKLSEKDAIKSALKEEMRSLFNQVENRELELDKSPAVFMFVGVNGVGKTTTIGKLGTQLAHEGKKIIFGAGDTFRAAAVTQLSIWGERAGIFVTKGKENADSASVLFDAINEAREQKADVVLCDTAGRLHTKTGLMDELKKVYRVMGKAQAQAPHEVFLVIDATMGQNAIAQAREFAEATPLTGVILTKLDGTAKGGVVLGIVDELRVPIRYIGIGEAPDDLRPFNADDFIEALFNDNER